MISRKHRFHGHGSLRFVYQQGKTVRGQFGSLKYAKNPRRKDYRMAVVVSKKVHKSAVVRNRIRRRIYEIVRKEFTTSMPEEAFDMVFTIFSDQVASMDIDELQERVLGKMREAGILSALKEKTDHHMTHDIVMGKEL